MKAPYDPRLPLDGLTRRTFLACSGVVGASAILAGAAACSWQDVRRRASENPLPSGAAVLVVVTLYGGNDGLNTVVPYADQAYQSARPGLAYTPDEVRERLHARHARAAGAVSGRPQVPVAPMETTLRAALRRWVRAPRGQRPPSA